ISDTRMWYGSSVRRQGRSRPWRRYHVSRRWRNRRRSGGDGILGTVKIYTRTGDAGETSLFGGTRVSKNEPRVEAYGDGDETNAWLGLARASGIDAWLGDEIVKIQKDLFAVGAQIADPAEKLANRVTKAVIGDADVARLEQLIDRLEEELPPLRRF